MGGIVVIDLVQINVTIIGTIVGYMIVVGGVAKSGLDGRRTGHVIVASVSGDIIGIVMTVHLATHQVR